MDNLWGNPNVNNKHCQLLFIECELWRFHPAEKHQVPIVNGNAGSDQQSLCVEPSFLDASSLFNTSNFSHFKRSKYLVEVNLLSINSSADDLENSTVYTALISSEFLSPQTLSYSRDCIDVKGFSERIEKQSVLDMERIYRLISYFLSCCQNRDCRCNFTINNESCIITWDPLKTKLLLNLDLFNNNLASSNSKLSVNCSCPNNLWNKLNSIIGLGGLIKSFLPEFWPAHEPSSSLELFSILENIAFSFNISSEDIFVSSDSSIKTTSVGELSLLCKYMARISLVLFKKGIITTHRERVKISEYKDFPHFENSNVRPVVRLRGLPWKAAILDIIAFFNPICKILVSDIAISYNKDGRMTGEAYVLLPSIRAYELSLTLLHGKRMGKRWIEVLPSSTQEFLICLQITNLRKQSQNPPLFTDSTFDRYCNRSVLRLRGLPWSTTELEIVQFFISGGIYDLNISDVFLGITENQRASGEAWIILPHKCDAFETQRILNRRIIGKRYIEVFISSFQELATARSTYSLKQCSLELFHALSSTSSNNSTCSTVSNGHRINGRTFSSLGSNIHLRKN
ncbi:RRM domains involved in RNA metabolism [Cryptosporidium sp. chipmunk genotype I]|uniref:RRM domains involved in RNA metabolism n=1 Tax=Cryptosporidium sp. chipmunk genotype I TaxID=1280935 RepID=UPI00351A927A|nr:RRM domains involved in RNA metabolism [Cryptosporidium sp. chipmunk genotype I]